MAVWMAVLCLLFGATTNSFATSWISPGTTTKVFSQLSLGFHGMTVEAQSTSMETVLKTKRMLLIVRSQLLETVWSEVLTQFNYPGQIIQAVGRWG